MYQSIPVVPIPLGISWAFAFNPGGGAFEILSLPRGKAFAYPLDDPGAFNTLVRFWSRT